MTVRRHPGVSRRLAYTTFLPTSWPSARAQRYLPRLLKCRISTSSAGEDVELFNELRGLVVKVQARKRLEDGSMKNFVEFTRGVIETGKIKSDIVEIQRKRLCQNDPRARGWGHLRQNLEAIRTLEHRLDTDAVKPRSRLSPKEREILKTEFSRYSNGPKTLNALRSVWKVALPLGFLYWAFNMGARP